MSLDWYPAQDSKNMFRIVDISIVSNKEINKYLLGRFVLYSSRVARGQCRPLYFFCHATFRPALRVMTAPPGGEYLTRQQPCGTFWYYSYFQP